MRVLVAGDHFVTPELVIRALDDDADVTTLMSAWPYEPYGPVAEVDEASGDEDELIAALDGVEVAVTQMAPFTDRVLAAADALRLVVCTRGGPVNVNVAAATKRGVVVCATPGRNAVAAAEHTIALLLAALRRIPDVHPTVRAGEWRSDLYALDAAGHELSGSTVGLVGYGEIGARVARILRAFDAEVLVYDPYAEQGPGFVTDVDELFARSSVVSLHARLTPETRTLVDAARLARMPRGGVLVNTARGGLVDYDAVVDALESGQLGAAAFDVFATEPPAPTDRLLTASNVVLTPHLAGATVQTARRAAEQAAAAVRAYARGDRPAAVVNPEAYETVGH
ncbi:2-hydroxyacid dehydrogenase [Virgisporangium aurantiacum]|uniref:Oxidoreductase n=1 Tax=Virgisporangium aurantiacum TaxID=175570 RepID=A0A8J3Z930_9ACTN|nr:2-hydroxyacid dehydrogenase [Virgisporangium aurantiacum]GIJ57441.1 oxidoreductase [Virgisporangium aurantiacum]